MYTMKEVCNKIGMSYETLKFYYKEGLVPNVKRDKNNYRKFDKKYCLVKRTTMLKKMWYEY